MLAAENQAQLTFDPTLTSFPLLIEIRIIIIKARFTLRDFKTLEKLHPLGKDVAGFEGICGNSFSLRGGLISLTSEGLRATGTFAEPELSLGGQ